MLIPSRILLAHGVLAAGLTAVAACAVDTDEPAEEVVLENEGEDGKADSVSGKRLVVTITDTVIVTSEPGGCGSTGDGPLVCGEHTGYGQVDVLVNDTVVGARGTRVMPARAESFYVFEARNEGFGLPNWRFIKYGQLLYARAAGTADWTLLRCPRVNYFSDRVTIDMVAREIINDGGAGEVRSLDACGAPAGAIEVSTFTFPISRWFGLEDTYHYDVRINHP